MVVFDRGFWSTTFVCTESNGYSQKFPGIQFAGLDLAELDLAELDLAELDLACSTKPP